MQHPEPPPSYMPANMRKERETHWLHVYEPVLTPKPAEPIDIDLCATLYSGLVQ